MNNNLRKLFSTLTIVLVALLVLKHESKLRSGPSPKSPSEPTPDRVGRENC